LLSIGLHFSNTKADFDDEIDDFATLAIPHGLVSNGVPTASEQAAEEDRLARQTAAEKAEAEERQREARKVIRNDFQIDRIKSGKRRKKKCCRDHKEWQWRVLGIIRCFT